MKKLLLAFFTLFIVIGSGLLAQMVEASSSSYIQEKQAMIYADKFLKVITLSQISVY